MHRIYQYIAINNRQDKMSVKSQPRDITNLQHQVEGKCMCEACSCGKHHCPPPHQKGQFHSSYNSQYPKYENYQPEGRYKMIEKNFILPQDKFYGQSSYTSEYNERNKTIQHMEKFKPKGELELSKEPFQANTSYIQDYLNRGQGKRAQRITHPNNKVLPQGKFDGDSNYHDNFVGGKAEKAQQFKPTQQLKVGGTFEGKSSYLNDFQNKGSPVRAERYPLPKNQIMPEGKFDGSTNYNHDFLKNSSERPKQFRPQGQLKLEGVFQGNSSYAADFENKGNAVRAERVPLPRNQILPEGKFSGDSNYHQNFIPSKIQRQQKFKPEGELKVGGGRFQGQSNYIADYLNRGVGQKAQRVPLPRNQVIPEGRFAGDSDYKSNFIEGKTERTKQIKHDGQLKVGGAFEGASSYGADYMSRGIGARSERIPLPKNQILPEGKFEGNSAYTGDYISSKVEKNPQFRPHGQLKVGQGNFQGYSSYSQDYLSKGKPIRAERVPLPKNQILPEGKFQSDSTYHENFISSKAEKQQQFRPVQQLKVGGQFIGGTSYGNDYSAKLVQREKCPCDTLEAPRYQNSERQHLRYNSNSHRWE